MRAQEELMEILNDVVCIAALAESAVERRNAGKLAQVSEKLRHAADHIDRLAVELVDDRVRTAA